MAERCPTRKSGSKTTFSLICCENCTPELDKNEVLDVVVQYIQDDLGTSVLAFNYYTNKGATTYELLEILFPPNTLIYRYHFLTEQHQVLLARSTSYEERNEISFFRISYDMITTDGENFGIATDELEIRGNPRGSQDTKPRCLSLQLLSKLFATEPTHHCARKEMTVYCYGQITGQAMRETPFGQIEKIHVCPLFVQCRLHKILSRPAADGWLLTLWPSACSDPTPPSIVKLRRSYRAQI